MYNQRAANPIKLALFIFSLSFCFLGFSQNFDSYKTLQCSGTMPKDFMMKVDDLMKEELIDDPKLIKDKKKQEYIRQLHENVKELLLSGTVTYGDEVSLYIQSIAQKLLADDQELFEKLRFYTIKSNETNALCTREGIIIVTTGLISQLANEAQLAYVLAHEMSHFTEKHMDKSYEYRVSNTSNYRSLVQMSNFSKEHELEADELAVKIYKNAGYSYDELVNTFDVLMYSYLPFDEIKMNSSFYTNNKMYLPQNLFSDKTYEITAVEDYNDRLNTHPNIKKRKEKTLEAAEKLSDWSNNVYQFGEETFKKIRNLARFENVRLDNFEANFGKALYSIYLLEKDFPKSSFLTQQKAYAWYGIGKFTNKSSRTRVIPKVKDSEGESAHMYFFLNELSKEALNFVVFRNLYEIYIKNPDDKYILQLVKDFALSATRLRITGIKSLNKLSYQDAKSKYQLKLDSSKTAQLTNIDTTSKGSKYDRIKTKKTEQAEAFDSTKFYLYGYQDILADSVYLAFFKKADTDEDDKIEDTESEESEENETEKIEEKKSKKGKKEEIETEESEKEESEKALTFSDMKTLLVVDPNLDTYFKNYTNRKKALSKKWEQNFRDQLQEKARESGISYEPLITSDILEESETENFNKRNALYLFLSRLNSVDEFSLVNMDPEMMTTLSEEFGTKYVNFALMEYYKVKLSEKFGSRIIFTFPIELPAAIVSARTTEFTFLTINIETGEVERSISAYAQGRPTKMNIANYLYHLFNEEK